MTVEQQKAITSAINNRQSLINQVDKLFFKQDISGELADQYNNFIKLLNAEELSALIKLNIDWSSSDLSLDEIQRQINTQILSDSFAENFAAAKTSVEELAAVSS